MRPQVVASPVDGCTVDAKVDYTDRVVYVDRGGARAARACSRGEPFALTAGAGCTFMTKVRLAEERGARAVVVGNVVESDRLFLMGSSVRGPRPRPRRPDRPEQARTTLRHLWRSRP
jgi:hypothetical protein